MIKYKLVLNTLSKKEKAYFRKNDEAIKKGLAAGGLQLINNIINGSPGAAAVPPKLTGHLRGSGSVFVGSVFIGDTGLFQSGGKPNRNHSERNENTITVGFDTPYAAKVNEEIGTKLKLGPVSIQSGNVEAHFLQKHITGDSIEITNLIADITKKEFGG